MVQPQRLFITSQLIRLVAVQHIIGELEDSIRVDLGMDIQLPGLPLIHSPPASHILDLNGTFQLVDQMIMMEVRSFHLQQFSMDLIHAAKEIQF